MAGTLEETVEQIKKQLIQEQLDSLGFSMENLACHLAHYPAEIIAGSCLAILKSISSLAYSCLVETIDRYDRSELQQRREDIQALTGYFTYDEIDDLHIDCRDREGALFDLANDIPRTERCFLPDDPSGMFIELAKALRVLFADELKYHCQSPSTTPRLSELEGDPVSEQHAILGSSDAGNGSVADIPGKSSAKAFAANLQDHL
ncbi:hypothetical protein FGADI_11324 [Fusarium gaditjirri]|uniref:Uncharacterized protein n=1 Tax=Fusarium gaditjirri TaxID=282569 RepID=A0A8H4WQ86_9HYPO|nr:hypothetical protein FGADI_11324 [Fusarium gaditjirri]